MFNKFQKKTSLDSGELATSNRTEARPVSKVPSIISADMTVRGDLIGGGDLQVEGKVFGTIDVGHLVIAKNGAVEGAIVAKAVAISGAHIGTVRAGAVTLETTAKVQGDILYDVLQIENGAQLEGQCKRVSSTSGGKLLSPPDAPEPPAETIEAA